jgi:hypothetical protein
MYCITNSIEGIIVLSVIMITEIEVDQKVLYDDGLS